MAAAWVCAVRDVDPPAEIQDLYLTDRLPDVGRIDGVMFSGGVAEYIYGRESRDFGDLGRRLGAALRRKLEAGELPWPWLPAKECIRATALGASEFSVQLSGNTIYISNHVALLPRRNLQVLKPPCEFPAVIDPQRVAQAIQRHLTLFDLSGEDKEFALAFQWRGEPSYERVVAFARGIVAGLARTVALEQPLDLILDGDLAQTLGGVLRDDLGIESEVLVIDGIVLVDFDYIDLGRIRLPSHTVPVTVKSLVFKDIPQSQAPPHRHFGRHDHHHHGHENHGHYTLERGPRFRLRSEK
jgi:ethanolamine utilization protein EutA